MDSHSHDTHPAHHDVSEDRGAAFIGLLAGVILLGVFIFGMVKFTNARYAAHEGGEKAAAESTR